MIDDLRAVADHLDAIASRRPHRSASAQRIWEAAATIRDAAAQAGREDLADCAAVARGLDRIAAKHGRRNAAAWAYRLADAYAYASSAPHG